jgi:hypothetical protein
MEPFLRLLHDLNAEGVRYVVIGVAGANYYAARSLPPFMTKDRDLFLPADVDNELRAWSVCERLGFELWSGDEPLGVPRDRWLAERIVERRMVVTALDGHELIVDLSLTMGGLEFEAVWTERRMFPAEDVEVPVARLAHIVESKRNAGRQKDLNFLITHEQALRDLLGEDDS